MTCPWQIVKLLSYIYYNSGDFTSSSPSLLCDAIQLRNSKLEAFADIYAM